MTVSLPQSLRSDARDNRDRILDAARSAFAADGLEVTMREVARRAEVGVATLYRRFPTKESLVTAAFADQLAACTAVVDDALADPDPWRGFCSVIEKVCAMQSVDRGFTAAFVSAYPRAVDFGSREQALHDFAEVTRRAKQAGQLRADFVLDDLIMLIMANGGIRAASPAATAAASRRFAALAIQSLRAHPGNAPLPPPVRLPLTASL